MSRTYRKKMEYKYDAYGRLWTRDELDAAGLGPRYVRVPCPWPDPVPSWAQDIHLPGDPGWRHVYVTPGLVGREVLDTRARDKKQWHKPNKAYKRIRRQAERARVRSAMVQRRDIPLFKRGDVWDWT